MIQLRVNSDNVKAYKVHDVLNNVSTAKPSSIIVEFNGYTGDYDAFLHFSSKDLKEKYSSDLHKIN